MLQNAMQFGHSVVIPRKRVAKFLHWMVFYSLERGFCNLFHTTKTHQHSGCTHALYKTIIYIYPHGKRVTSSPRKHSKQHHKCNWTWNANMYETDAPFSHLANKGSQGSKFVFPLKNLFSIHFIRHSAFDLIRSERKELRHSHQFV